jgi:TonB-linked SusC/RagA family outer membrane protein
MRSKFTCVCTLLVAFIAQFSFAQQKAITGKVSDQSGLPLPGVSIVIKGTTRGTQTDFDGNYTVNANVGQTLVYSYIGEKTIERTVGSSNTINVKMEEDAEALEEVVVVAYGKQKGKSIVGSVATVGTDIIGKQQLASVVTSIQGSVPGVNVISAGGQPGDNPTIRIRGVSSINADASPLIIVDGAPFNGNLNTISADQVESINVLKDASSTALYGSRGSNGVILITTKRGRFDTPVKVSISSSVGFANQAVKFHDLLDSDTYMEYSWEALRNSNQYIGGQDAITAGQDASDDLVTILGYNPYGIPNPVDASGNLVSSTKLWDTDWASLLFNNSALRSENSLSVSGGSDSTTYFFAANYLAQEGSITTSHFDRITVRMNVDTRINQWFNIGLNAFYSSSEQNYPTQEGTSFQSATQWVFTIPSIYPVYRRDDAGQLILDSSGAPIYDYGNNPGQIVNGIRPDFGGENAVGALYNYDVLNNRDNFTANTYAQINFTENLSFKTNLAYEKYLLDSFSYVNSEVGYAAGVGGRVSQDRDITTTTNLINALNYNKNFGDHTIGLDLIQEAYNLKIEGLGAQGIGFLPDVKVLNGSTSPESVSGYLTQERLSSYLGRVTYNFKERYYLEGSYRRDGSTRFAEDSRWGNFFSVGGSWIVSGENFLANSDVLSFLKIKASYGELGNNRGIGYFPYLQLFQTGWNELDNTGVLLGGVTDPNLTWEKTKSSNFGIEFGFLKNKINATVDYYDKESIDLIYNKPLPPSTGNSSITTNVGAVRNYGIEISLNTKNIQKENLIWTTGLNFSMDKNEITELTQESFISGTKRWEEGRSLYEFWIQEYAGVDPDTGYAMWYTDVLDDAGEPTGERETTTTYSSATRYYIGKSSLPDIIGGFTNYIRVHNFDMNILFNFSLGSYVYDSTYAGLMSGFESPGNAASPDLAKRWQNPGDITDVPLFLASNNDFSTTSTRFLFKNDYARLKALNIGYNVPTEPLSNIGVSSLRFYMQADNLLTFQSHKGIDPEQSLAGTTNNRSFNQRIVSFGLNLEF